MIRASRLAMMAMGFAVAMVEMATPAGATTTTTFGPDEAQPAFTVDKAALVHGARTGGLLLAALAAVTLAVRILRAQHRRTWGTRLVATTATNKLARAGMAIRPESPIATTPEDELPNWLVTGSHDGVRRVSAGLPDTTSVGAAMSARMGPISVL